MQKRLVALALCAALLGGCGIGGVRLGFPGVYRIDIAQGNIVTQEMVDKLQPGMNKRQVRFVMGTPLIIDTFEPERWDYFRSFDKRGRQHTQERVSLFFENDLLVRVEGDLKPGGAGEAAPAAPGALNAAAPATAPAAPAPAAAPQDAPAANPSSK